MYIQLHSITNTSWGTKKTNRLEKISTVLRRQQNQQQQRHRPSKYLHNQDCKIFKKKYTRLNERFAPPTDPERVPARLLALSADILFARLSATTTTHTHTARTLWPLTTLARHHRCARRASLVLSLSMTRRPLSGAARRLSKLKVACGRVMYDREERRAWPEALEWNVGHTHTQCVTHTK